MSVFTLKIIALILMIIDHIGNFFPKIEGVLFMRILGRLVAPIFFYMLIEGFVYTSSRKKYANRLLMFAGIMFIGNSLLYGLIYYKNISVMYSINPLCPNIFLSMYLGVIILGDLENIRFYVHKTNEIENCYSNAIISIIRMIICIILSLYTEGSIYGIFMIFVFYLLRENTLLKTIIYISGTILICVIENNFIQIFMLFSIFLLLFYNGEKGYSSKNSKYFFYIFYIIHIWALCLISLFSI